MIRPWVLLACLTGAACGGSGATRTDTRSAPASATSPSATSGPATAQPQPSGAAAFDIGAAADALLASWLAAQNEGKHALYMTLYDGSFRGVRRTADGGEKAFDRDGWSKDRERLFKGKQEVAAESVGKKIEGEVVTLSFTQRWRSAKSADHGEKILELRVFDGKLRIVREELKWSERGWEDGKEKALDATALVSPIEMTVERVRLEDNGDCSATKLRVHLQDKRGTKRQLDHGIITGMGGEASGRGGRLAPKNGEYSDLGVYCAGLQQGYTLKVAGDTLVALSIWMDEESGPGKDSKVLVKLPPGAEVVTR